MATRMVTAVMNLPHKEIAPDPNQPRTEFKTEPLERLAENIGAYGLLQPITVKRIERPTNGIKYQLIAGERRWRAIGMLGWEKIPAIVKKISDDDAVKLQLLENLVREDLNPVEEAKALKRFLDAGVSLLESAKTVGLAEVQIAWRVEMLGAREDILHLVAIGQMLPSLAHKLAKLSLNGQAKVLRLMDEHMTYPEARSLCEKVGADENQTSMDIPEPTAENKSVARSFGQVFEQVGKLLCKLDAIETDNPGSLAEAMSSESAVAEARIQEIVKGFNRLQKALRTRRIQQKVAVAA